MRLVEICIGKAGLSGFSFSETNNLRFLVHDNQKVKIKCDKKSELSDSVIKEEECPGAWLGVHELLVDGDGYLLNPTINEYSFNPIIYCDPRSGFDIKEMYFVTINNDAFTQLRYYTNCEIIATFNDKKRNEIGCIFLASNNQVFSDYYFAIHGKNKDGKYASYNYDFGTESLSYSEKFKKERLSRLKSIYKKYKSPLVYRYSGTTIPKYILCKEKEVDEMLELYGRLIYSNRELSRDDINIIVLPDTIDCSNPENDDLIASLISGKVNRTKGLLLSDSVTLPYDLCKKERLIYLFKVSEKNGCLSLHQASYR